MWALVKPRGVDIGRRRFRDRGIPAQRAFYCAFLTPFSFLDTDTYTSLGTLISSADFVRFFFFFIVDISHQLGSAKSLQSCGGFVIAWESLRGNSEVVKFSPYISFFFFFFFLESIISPLGRRRYREQIEYHFFVLFCGCDWVA